MFAGRLDRRIKIYQLRSVQNEINESIQQWDLFAEVWAGIAFKSGREVLQADQINAQQTQEFRIRWMDGILDRTDFEIEFEGQRYNIDFIFEIGRRDGLSIVATMKVFENAAA